MPRILLLPDKRGWIFDFLTTYEAEALRKRGWHVDIVFQEDNFSTPLPASQYDIVFNPSYSPRAFERQFEGRLVRGIFGHKWAWAENPRRALDKSLQGACAVIVPNRELLSMISWYFPNTFQVTEGTDAQIFRFERHNMGDQLIAAWTGDPKHTWKGLQDILMPACERVNVPLRIASNLSREELNLFYNTTDVVLVATKNEGSPNCVFEAGACGRPVIGTRAGIIPEAIVDAKNGFIIERSIEAFVEKLTWCKENREKLREMGMAHREVVLRKYTVQEHTRQFCDLMEKLLSDLQSGKSGQREKSLVAGAKRLGKKLIRRVSGAPVTVSISDLSIPTMVNSERKISLEKIREYEVGLVAPLMPLGSKVLEIGAGAGWQSKTLSEYGFAVEAIDVEGSRYGGRRIWPVLHYDGTNIPFSDAHFDVVFSSNVLEHVKQLDQFLDEIKRVIKPDGIAVHLVPSSTWRLWSLFATVINAWKQLVVTLLSLFYHRYVLSDMTQEKATTYKQNMIRFLKQTIYPPPAHGEIGNCISELYLFSRPRWTSLFRRKGWSIRSYYPNRLFYSGGTCLTFIGIKSRHIMSYILGSSCHIYVLEKA